MTATILIKLFFVELSVVLLATLFNLTVAELFTLLGLLGGLTLFLINMKSDISKLKAEFHAEINASNKRIESLCEDMKGKASNDEVLRQHAEVKEEISKVNSTVTDIYQILINRN